MILVDYLRISVIEEGLLDFRPMMDQIVLGTGKPQFKEDIETLNQGSCDSSVIPVVLKYDEE